MHCTSKSLILGAFGPALRRSSLPPAFLIPSFTKTPASRAPFSSTAPSHARKDGNPSRGVSALRHSGLGKRQKLRVTAADLPKPVSSEEKRSKIEVDPDHGLYGFFNEQRDTIVSPADMRQHGRPWSEAELRLKDWEDLHKLWWVCIKELNRLATARVERERIGDMYGEYEEEQRFKAVKGTLKAIRKVLTQRWYTWEDARMAALDDPSVNLHADPDKGEQAWIPPTDPLEDEEDSGQEVLEESHAGELPLPPSGENVRDGREVRV